MNYKVTDYHYQGDERMEIQELIKRFETLKPEELLSDLSGGNDVAEGDLKLVGQLQAAGLNDGVINVLIDYVILMTGGKLTYDYVLKIASHWSRKKVATVEKAIEFARKEHKYYQKWQSGNFKIVSGESNRISELDSIKGAIKANLNDEQLGKYVRNLLSEK